MNWRVGKDTFGRWHFIDHEGTILFLRGVFAIEPDNSRPAFFRELYAPGTTGDAWRAPWALSACRRAREWGFNAASEYNVWDIRPGSNPWSCPQGLPYIVLLKLASYTTERYGGEVPDLIGRADQELYVKLTGTNYRGGTLIDPFDLKFQGEVERFFEDKRDDQLKYGEIESEHCIGVTLDDADHYFSSGPGPRYVTPRVHPSTTAIVQANPDSAAFRELKRYTGSKANRRFQEAFAAQLIGTLAGAVRRHFPGKLVFSPASLNQWGGVSRPAWLKAVGDYCDVVNIAIGNKEAYAPTVQRVGDRPLVVWDTAVANPDSAIHARNPIESPQWPPIAETQRGRGMVYQERARMYRAMPNVAGVSWWSWHDHPGEAMNFGLVTTKDEPYPDFVEKVAAVNSEEA